MDLRDVSDIRFDNFECSSGNCGDHEMYRKEPIKLKNTLNFTHSNDEIFFGFDMSVYETLKDLQKKFDLAIVTSKSMKNAKNFLNLFFPKIHFKIICSVMIIDT